MPDITIQVDDEDILDTNEAPRPKRVVNDAGFNDLKDQLDKVSRKADDAQKKIDEERRRADDAEVRARRDRDDASRARQDAQTARTERNDDRKIALTNAVTTQTALLDGFETEYASAMEAGDFKKAAAAQRKMAVAAAELKQIEAGVSSIDDEPASDRGAKKTEGRVERTQSDDPFEKYVTQFSSKAEAWLRKHPEAVTDKSKNSRVLSAHHKAEADGVKIDSDEYFQRLDEEMGYSDRAADAVRRDNPTDDPPERRTTSMRSAPVSRGNGTGGSSNTVSLTSGEVEAANSGSIVWNVGQVDHRGVRLTDKDPRVGEPIGNYEYARRKKAMGKEGRYETPYAS